MDEWAMVYYSILWQSRSVTQFLVSVFCDLFAKSECGMCSQSALLHLIPVTVVLNLVHDFSIIQPKRLA